MKFEIGQLVTPTVKSKGYCLGDHGRIVGEYYEIVQVNAGSARVRLSGENAGWLNVNDIKLKSQKVKKEDHTHLVKLLKKLNIK